MARLRCDKCGSSDTNAFGSWSTTIKILCKKCSPDPRTECGSDEFINIELNEEKIIKKQKK